MSVRLIAGAKDDGETEVNSADTGVAQRGDCGAGGERLTAFPLETELRWVVRHVDWVPLPGLVAWLHRVHEGLAVTNREYPFLAYGTDWLAFAHLVLAILFIGPWLDPVRNKWVIDFGLIACGRVLLLALIAGPVRGIPVYWWMIDCSFGVFGAIPLWLSLRDVRRLEPERKCS